MLIIGSQAMKHHKLLPKGRKIRDTDFIATFAEFNAWTRKHKAKIVRCVPLSGDKFHVKFRSGWNFEFEIAWPGSTGEKLMMFDIGCGWDQQIAYASPDALLGLKLSHRYLKNSPFFLKTMRDIQRLRRKGIQLNGWMQSWLKQREEETYTYSHPKLDVTSKDFFTGDGVNYLYDHDSIHLAVALTSERNMIKCPDGKPGCMVAHFRTTSIPAYTFYMKDGSEVMTSKEKFFSVDEKVRLYGVYEETCVLALERSQIPHNFIAKPQDRFPPTARWSFEMALMKVCTSITSGWFREYAWENYNAVMALYIAMGEDDYVKRFHANAHLLKPYEKELN